MSYNNYPKVDLNNKQEKKKDKSILLKEHTVTAYQEYKVTLDAGHGDHNTKTWGHNKDIHSVYDPGATFDVHYEKDYAIKIDAATYRWLEYFGISTIRTRTQDVNVDPEGPINWRWKIANKRKSKILVSFHLNNDDSENLFAVYEHNRSNEKNSINLATHILTGLKAITKTSETEIIPASKTGVKTLGVLRNFNGDAGILIEFGGIKSEENLNNITKNSNKYGFWIALGIYKYLNNGLEPEIFKSTPAPLNNSTFGEAYKAWASEK
jgi:N-acetylmuramoyl-L-alanine amidase